MNYNNLLAEFYWLLLAESWNFYKILRQFLQFNTHILVSTEYLSICMFIINNYFNIYHFNFASQIFQEMF